MQSASIEEHAIARHVALSNRRRGKVAGHSRALSHGTEKAYVSCVMDSLESQPLEVSDSPPHILLS